MEIQNVQWQFLFVFGSYVLCTTLLIIHQMHAHTNEVPFKIANLIFYIKFRYQKSVVWKSTKHKLPEILFPMIWRFFSSSWDAPAYKPPSIYKANIGVCYTAPIIVPEYKVYLALFKRTIQKNECFSLLIVFSWYFLNFGWRRL